MKYRKKPVIIEAFKLNQRHLNWPDWAFLALSENKIVTYNMGKFSDPTMESYALIETLEGIHKASVGDYIIQGVKGEIYPCKSDIFEMTYEAIDE